MTRTKLCHCGSGRPFFACCGSKLKPRTTEIIFEASVPRTVDSLYVSPHRGIVSPLSDGVPVPMKAAWVTTAYGRSKGPKLLTRVSFAGPIGFTSPSAALTHYDFVLAIDTNTRHRAAGSTSVALVVSGSRASVHVPDHTVYAMHVVGGYEFRDCHDDPERVGWWMAFSSLIDSPDYARASRIGVVVDSSLGALPAINARQEPVYRAFMLPDRLTLIYASTDAGTDVPNKLIRLADSEGRTLLKQLESEDDGTLQTARPTDPFSHYRIWYRQHPQAAP